MVEADPEQARERLRKQSYLEEKIMGAGYDINEFATFMWYQKAEGGDNVDNFTYDEILQVCELLFHFRLTYPPFRLRYS